MAKEIPLISGIDCIRNPTINSGEGNFIQIYFDNIPYFRAGQESHCKLLENFLREVEIEDFDKIEANRSCFTRAFIAEKDEQLYKVVGAGTISEATIIPENVRELSGRGYIAIRGYSEDYNLYPSIEHISKIIKHFPDPLIFVGSEYWTEEEKGFLDDREDLGGEDGDFLEQGDHF